MADTAYDERARLDGNKRLPVALAQLTEDTRCPVCFGLLKQTVASTVCLHRFCAACIDHCLSGRPPQHKDCPVCRTNLHSRRSLRPDPNFDLLLRALYGEVETYAQEEDSLVAAHNAAHAAETAEEAALRRQQRAVQEAARAASRPPHLARKSSGAGSATLGRQASASASLGSDSAGGPSGGAGSKRSREAVIEQGGNGGPLGSPSGPVKRQNSMLAPHTQAQATAAALRKQHSLPPRRASGRLTSPSPAAGGAGLSPPPSHSSPGPSPFGRLAQQPRPHRLTLASPSPAPSCLSDVRESPRAGQGRASNDGSSGAGAGAGAGSVPPPRGPLAAPSARCASELSFRHPGMVVVQLVPGQGGGGAGAGPGACLSPSGRPLRLASPALEKPFVLCPARWTVAHVAQLLSQWLPPRGYGPSAARVPPSSVLLEPAPGLLRGRHRSLRGCTQLGVLAAEAEGEQTGAGAGTAQRGGGRGGAALSDYAGGVLVLHYSVVPGSPA